MSPSSPAGSSSSSLPDSSALLALPDGPIPANHADRTSYAISLIGGYPTFPLSTPPLSSDLVCASCSAPIPLLAQVYCPPEGGENDRTLYVFACPNGGCQRKEGSVRAWRASRRNDEYVADVEKRRAEKEAEEKRLADERRKNPFTVRRPVLLDVVIILLCSADSARWVLRNPLVLLYSEAVGVDYLAPIFSPLLRRLQLRLNLSRS